MKSILVFVTTASLYAATPRCVTAGRVTPLSITTLGQGTRNIGMGGTGVADITQPTTGYYNPATLAWADAIALSSNYQTWIEDVATLTDTRLIAGRFLGDTTSADGWLVGSAVGYTRINWEFEERTIPQPEGTGRTLKLTDQLLTFALAGGWDDAGRSIAAGAAAKYANLDAISDDVTGWMYDYGIVIAVTQTIEGSLIRPRLGFSMSNLDTGVDIDSTEYSVENWARVGLGIDFATPHYTFGRHQVPLASASLDVDYTDREDSQWFWAVGWEVSILELVHARAGVRWFEDNESSVHTLGFGVGWDFVRWMFRIDYAHEAPVVPNFSLDIDRDMFGATVGARF